MATKRPREGSLLRINIGNGMDAFARVLPNCQVAIYSRLLPEKGFEFQAVYSSTILWKLTVMKSALMRWPVVDFKKLESELLAPVDYFIKDKASGGYSVYRSSDGETRPSTPEECKSLEAAAVWEATHVEDRLRDHLAGRPNAWAEQLKA